MATDRVRQLDALLGDPDEVRARLSQDIPLRRYGEPAEFGQAAAFVLSPRLLRPGTATAAQVNFSLRAH